MQDIRKEIQMIVNFIGRTFLTLAILLFTSFSVDLPQNYHVAYAALRVDNQGYQTDVFHPRSGAYKLFLSRTQYNSANSPKDILLIHGVTYSSHEFNVDYKDYSLVKYLARQNYSVWCLDIAGFGQSDKVADGFLPNSDYASEDIHAAVEFIVKQNGGKPIDILGWSWGTVTTSRFASKYPQLVRRIVLYAPIVAGLGEANVNEPFHHNDWNHAADDFQKTSAGEIDFSIVEKPVADTFLSNAWRYDKELSPNGGRQDLMVSENKRLIPTKNLKMPVLIISGSKDQYVSPTLCQEAYKSLGNQKDSQIFIMEGASHVMMMEQPFYKIFREKVIEFLI